MYIFTTATGRTPFALSLYSNYWLFRSIMQFSFFFPRQILIIVNVVIIAIKPILGGWYYYINIETDGRMTCVIFSRDSIASRCSITSLTCVVDGDHLSLCSPLVWGISWLHLFIRLIDNSCWLCCCLYACTQHTELRSMVHSSSKQLTLTILIERPLIHVYYIYIQG